MSGEVSPSSSSSKCEVFDLCDSDDKDTSLPLPLDQSCASLKSNDACLFVSRGAAFVERRKLAARQASRSSLDDTWEAARRESCPGSGVYSKENVGATARGGGGEWHEVKQEEEFNDDGFVVGLSFIDHEGPRHCAISGIFVGHARSICCGTNAPGSAILEEGGCRDL